jgi:hypothetical protein
VDRATYRVINQIRGLLLERGITVRKGRAHIEASLLAILEDAYNKLSGILRVLLAQMQLEMQYLRRQIDESDKVILEIAKGMDSCRWLIAIPGIGRQPRSRRSVMERLLPPMILFCAAGVTWVRWPCQPL